MPKKTVWSHLAKDLLLVQCVHIVQLAMRFELVSALNVTQLELWEGHWPDTWSAHLQRFLATPA